MLSVDRPIITRRRITRLPWPAIVTGMASVVALVAIANLAGNWLEVYLVFFGEQPEILPSNITAYRVWGLIAGIALAFGLVAHVLNRRRRVIGTIWQTLLVLGGTAIVAICYIPGAIDLPAPQEEDDGYHAPPCYSGGDNDECVGG